MEKIKYRESYIMIKKQSKKVIEADQKDSLAPVLDQGTRLRIKVRTFDHKLMDQACRTIIDNALRTGAKVQGPVPLPTEKVRYTVNRSTFVHKDAREQFEVRVHKRLIDIYNPKAKTIEELSNLNLPSGVDVEIKM